MRRYSLITLTLFAVGACETIPGTDGGRFLSPVPEGVLSVADPRQNLEQVVLLEEDNCYWYNHTGPVETTLLPLRSTDGRTICAPKPATDDSAES